MKTRHCFVLLLVCIGFIRLPRAGAVDIAPPYNTDYSIFNLGAPTGVPGYLGGLTIKAGDPNTLLIGGNANGSSGAIYQIGITRDSNNHITGFTGSATKYADAPNIDGGLAYGPGGVLFYTTYSNNTIGQIKPGSTGPDKTIALGDLGVSSSTGSLQFAPDGSLKIAQYSSPGNFYTSTLVSDGTGTYNITGVTNTGNLGSSGPEGIAYVPVGSPQFTTASILLSDYGQNKVWSVQVDSNWNPILSTKQLFVNNLGGAEGAFFDQYSGDFLFSQYGSPSQVLSVRGFNAPIPEPSTYALAAISTAVIAYVARRRKRLA